MPLKDPEKRREYEKNRTRNKRHNDPEFRIKTNAIALKGLKKRIKNRYEFIEKLKIKCEICGEDRKCCLDFHHKDPSTKSYSVVHMAHNSFKLEDILAEVAKCSILCANCHRVEHARIKEENLCL